MLEIKDLLLRFSNILLREEVKKESVRDIINQTAGVRIESENLKIKNNTVYLNTKPIFKNEILFKKDEILAKLKEALGKKAPQNII